MDSLKTMGGVERVNRNIRDSIFLFLQNTESKRWVDKLPFFAYIYNTSVHSTIKMTPFMAHRGRLGLLKMDALVQERINKNAQNMIKRFAREKAGLVKRRKTPEMEIVKVGDNVRVSTQSMIEVRAMGDIVIRSKLKKGSLTGYTKEVYTVLRIEEKEDGNVLYKLTGDHKRNYYLRHELLKVDIEGLIPVEGKQGKVDLNFGKEGK
jgi:hypothetical protein